MSRRKYVQHGAKRVIKKAVSLAGTGAQAIDLSMEQSELVKIATDPCTATTLTISLTDLYDGAKIVLDYDSNVACDTLTIRARAGSGDLILSSGTFDDNARSRVEIEVFDATKGAEVVSVVFTTLT